MLAALVLLLYRAFVRFFTGTTEQRAGAAATLDRYFTEDQ